MSILAPNCMLQLFFAPPTYIQYPSRIFIPTHIHAHTHTYSCISLFQCITKSRIDWSLRYITLLIKFVIRSMVGWTYRTGNRFTPASYAIEYTSLVTAWCSIVCDWFSTRLTFAGITTIQLYYSTRTLQFDVNQLAYQISHTFDQHQHANCMRNWKFILLCWKFCSSNCMRIKKILVTIDSYTVWEPNEMNRHISWKWLIYLINS